MIRSFTSMLQEQERLDVLRRMLSEPRLVDVQMFRHSGVTWWRFFVACGCDGCQPGPAMHEMRIRMVPGGELRKPQRLSRRVGRWVSDADARELVRALHAYVNAKES